MHNAANRRSASPRAVFRYRHQSVGPSAAIEVAGRHFAYTYERKIGADSAPTPEQIQVFELRLLVLEYRGR